MVFSNRVNHQDMMGAKEVFNRVGYCLSIEPLAKRDKVYWVE
jgi:hypothetical protein